MNHRILIVDDEKNTREGLKWALEGEALAVDTAPTAEEALEKFHDNHYDLILTDLKMPGMDGLELLRQLKSEDPQLEIIMLTAHGTVETAVEAMRQGAFDYQIKPVDLEELKLVCERALRTRQLGIENTELKSLVDKRFGFENIIGNSPAIENIFGVIRQVAPTRATVLIQGESGTGKELIAHALHLNSPRAKAPFVPVNCGALTETLLESELFGYEKGAFTHAVKTKPGRFERADGGTIFLDEIGETSPEFQVKLLRVLQDQIFERVGGVEPIKVDVRVVAATNKDLDEMVKKGSFREDLFYRLNVVQIRVPPLRERREDIPLLAGAFLREFGELNSRPGMQLHPKALALLQDFHWPGNVRQLRNVIEGMVVMTAAREIGVRNLPDAIREVQPAQGTVAVRVGKTLAEMEREMIRATLAELDGNRAQTAKTLGIGRKTLYRKMQEYEIE